LEITDNKVNEGTIEDIALAINAFYINSI